MNCTPFRFEGGIANAESFADFLERFEQLCGSLHCTGSEKLQLLSGGVLMGKAGQMVIERRKLQPSKASGCRWGAKTHASLISCEDLTNFI